MNNGKLGEFIDADNIILQESSSETATNSEATYTSRLMSFTNLSKPMNSTGVQIEDPEGNFNCIYFYIHLYLLTFGNFLLQFQIHN